MHTSCVRCIVSGRVQGVWFRAGAREQAEALGLQGHARNLPDGRVEVLAAGPDDALEQLVVWLWQGTPRARVEAVEQTVMQEVPPSGFRIL
ncbi:acylphosphatase [Natronocella acetinitrilica]|uniref:acylphosphatase n=1 Tax=Natronocella acetinitrilica TaxID=414046 RepID=A0AAE3G369_9GAMM|nr:acylphosphatase [Natronocella acetinitrilica]MCP1674970.1 acylphosphatase [Natronocella acetinitrilica]